MLYPVVVRGTAMASNETVKVEVLVSATAAQAAAAAHGIEDAATWLLEAARPAVSEQAAAY